MQRLKYYNLKVAKKVVILICNTLLIRTYDLLIDDILEEIFIFLTFFLIWRSWEFAEVSVLIVSEKIKHNMKFKKPLRRMLCFFCNVNNNREDKKKNLLITYRD